MSPKPFRTVDQQVEILKSRGVAFDDEERAKAFLLRENYYAVVNGYKDILLDKQSSNLAGEDRYLPGISFRDFELIYTFDKALRNATMSLLLDAENAMKTAVVYAFCSQHGGSDDYLDPACYCSRSAYRNSEHYTKGLIRLLSTLQRIRDNAPRKAYIRHYDKQHGCPPLWVLSKCLTFGSASAFFDYQQQSVKTAACVALARALKKSVVPQKKLAYAFHTLPEFRNICAHDERLYCAKVGKHNDKGFRELIRAVDIAVPEEVLKAYLAAVRGMLNDVRREAPSLADKLLKGMGIRESDLV